MLVVEDAVDFCHDLFDIPHLLCHTHILKCQLQSPLLLEVSAELNAFSTEQQGESVESFINSLYNLAKGCEYEAMKREMICNHIIVRIHDSKSSERLQLDAELTLEKAKKIIRQCRVHEQQVILKSEGLKPLKADLPVDSVGFKKPPTSKLTRTPTLGSKCIPRQGDKQSKEAKSILLWQRTLHKKLLSSQNAVCHTCHKLRVCYLKPGLIS